MNYRHFSGRERVDVGCRECSECVGASHHWIELFRTVGGQFVTHQCKHCDQLGDCCEACEGDGCPACEGEGVLPVQQLTAES